MRNFIVMFILVLLGGLLSGCGDRTELNELGIISATGIDGKEGAWSVTYQTIIPSAMSSATGGSGGGGSQAAIHTFSTEGQTIREAIDITNLENPRKLYFAHNNVLIIGKKAAEAGIGPIVDYYLRNFESRETVNVLIADKDAKEILKQLVPPEMVPGVALAKILEKNTETGAYFPSITMYEIAQKISSDSSAAGIPQISIVGTGEDKIDSIEVFQKTSSDHKLKLSGLCVFSGTKRLATLKPLESQGISWLDNNITTSTLSFEQKNKKGGKSLTSFRIRTARVTTTPVKGPLHYTLHVKAKLKGEITESSSAEDISKVEVIQSMQDKINKKIESEIQDSWEAIQKLNIDILGIANKIHRKYPKDWSKIKESWPEELAKIDLKVEVETAISRPGLFQKSFDNVIKPK